MVNNNIDPSLPIVWMEPIDLNGFLFLNCPSNKGLGDVLNDLEWWITTVWAIENRREYERLNETGKYHFTDEELDEIERDECVISPVTLWAYESDQHRQKIGWDKKKPWEKERHILDLYPGRFAARYKQNKGYVNARKEKTKEELEDEQFEHMQELEKRHEEELKKIQEEASKQTPVVQDQEEDKHEVSIAEALTFLVDLTLPNDEICNKIKEWHNV